MDRKSNSTINIHHALILLVAATLAVSIYSLDQVNEIKSALVPERINIADFVEKLTVHEEAAAFAGTNPTNIVQINNNNFADLQRQVAGIDISYIGNYLVQYDNAIIIYDYANDVVRGAINLPSQIPADFSVKYFAHPETQNLQDQQPQIVLIDEAGLQTLQQQSAGYANAKVGDYLLGYPDLIVIYDYQDDRIVNVVNSQFQ